MRKVIRESFYPGLWLYAKIHCQERPYYMTSEGKCHFLANSSWFTDIPEQNKGDTTVTVLRVFLFSILANRISENS
jgi:hypothetical protein